MEWTRGPTIGRGSTAAVSLATSSTGHLFAVKSTRLAFSDQLKRESQILSRLTSPHVVNFIGCQVSEEENGDPLFNLFMEYLPSGTISDEIKRRKGSLDEYKIRSYTRDLLMGLDYLHSNGIAHRDIKSQNVLLGKFGAKIGDFGCAGDCSMSEFSGTPVFMAPEVARGEEQWFPADVWAAGCVVIEMATGSCPWPEITNPVSALYRIGFSNDLPEFPMWMSKEGRDFLSKCLVRESKERWTAKQLLQHPFVNNIKVPIDHKFDEVEVFERDSPCSVLGQTFWDRGSPVSSSVSPANRIQRLMSSNVCNWTVDEIWVTVRSNCFNEGEVVEEKDDILGEDDRVLAGAGDLVTENLKKKLIEFEMLNKEYFQCSFMFYVLCVAIVKLKSMQILMSFSGLGIHYCFCFSQKKRKLISSIYANPIKVSINNSSRKNLVQFILKSSIELYPQV